MNTAHIANDVHNVDKINEMQNINDVDDIYDIYDIDTMDNVYNIDTINNVYDIDDVGDIHDIDDVDNVDDNDDNDDNEGSRTQRRVPFLLVFSIGQVLAPTVSFQVGSFAARPTAKRVSRSGYSMVTTQGTLRCSSYLCHLFICIRGSRMILMKAHYPRLVVTPAEAKDVIPRVSPSETAAPKPAQLAASSLRKHVALLHKFHRGLACKSLNYLE